MEFKNKKIYEYKNWIFLIWIALLVNVFLFYVFSDLLVGNGISKRTFIVLSKHILFIIFLSSELLLIKTNIYTDLALLFNIISLISMIHIMLFGKNNEYNKFLSSFFISTLASFIGAAGSIIGSLISK